VEGATHLFLQRWEILLVARHLDGGVAHHELQALKGLRRNAQTCPAVEHQP
jgi:hypothetical protein